MPDTFGLMGANNPILQASQQMNQQSAQMRNVAADGIVKKITTDYEKKIGAQLKTYANYMESKDPFIFQKGAEGMYSLMGEEVPPDILEHQQEVNLAYSELNKREGKIPAQDFLDLANSVLSRFGSLPTGMEERARTAVDTAKDPINQPLPENIRIQYGLPEGMTIAQATKLGVNLADIQTGKKVERVDDVGDRIKTTYTDGTVEYERKGAAPGAGVQERRLSLAEEREAKKDAAAAKKETARTETALGKADLVTGKIDKALNQAGFFTTGFIGGLLSNIKGTSAYDLDKTIDTVKANIGFQELSDMRAASPTGGALGQIAVRELEFLQAALGSLEPGQSREQLVENLKAVKTHYENWKNTVKSSSGATAITTTGGKRSLDSFGR